MAHVVICPLCKTKFDRDKEEYVVISSRRYAHAACALRAKAENPDLPDFKIINPFDFVKCHYCKKDMNRQDEDCVHLGKGKYAHKACADLEKTRELTDKEKLDQYIMQLFGTEYVSPLIQKQINKFITEYNYTYSGILKSLKYFFEVKQNSLEKAHGGIGIVPYIYQNAYEYYYSIWLAQQKNELKEISVYQPKIVEITIKRPQRKVKQRKLFTFLDEEEEN